MATTSAAVGAFSQNAWADRVWSFREEAWYRSAADGQLYQRTATGDVLHSLEDPLTSVLPGDEVLYAGSWRGEVLRWTDAGAVRFRLPHELERLVPGLGGIMAVGNTDEGPVATLVRGTDVGATVRLDGAPVIVDAAASGRQVAGASFDGVGAWTPFG